MPPHRQLQGLPIWVPRHVGAVRVPSSCARSVACMELNPQIGMQATTGATAGQGAFLAPKITVAASVPGGLTWQRKWREIAGAHTALAEIYGGNRLHQDNFTKAIEDFFKLSRELADWIDQQVPGVQAMGYVNSAVSLQLCNAMAQTSKHHTRTHGITAKVNQMYSDAAGIHADIAWTDGSTGGTVDALQLASDCIAEWQAFFLQHQLDPAS
jgi:hypothetical protein